MNIEPAEPTETNTPKPYSESAVPAAARVSERSPLPAQVVCNLTEGETFVERRTEPHVPVLAAFGIGQLHTCRLYGCWDLVQMVKDNSEALFRSIRKLPNECKAQEGEPKPAENWDDLTFQLGPQTFVYADATRIVGFASTAEEAKRWVTKFGAAYRKPEPEQETGGEYFLIQTGMEIKTHRVTLAADTRLSPETFRLHYGDEFVRWHQQFVEQLKTNDRGLSIFEGRPGTGKTFYLRHLMAELKQTHRFYFISTGNLGMLTRPDFVGFWADLRQEHPKSQFVAILEDSDAALMTRGSDNREMVSAILNLTDGMLADFLRLQILCTINCTAADIDPALLRPGRLLNHRVFGRLNYTEARRLAESLGRELPLPGDYSLAEVFAGKEQPEDARRQIGFAAALA